MSEYSHRILAGVAVAVLITGLVAIEVNDLYASHSLTSNSSTKFPSQTTTVTETSSSAPTNSTTTSLSTTTALNSTQSVGRQYAAYLQELKSENVTALTSGYQSNATLVFTYAPSTGAMSGGGHYLGANISNFYQSFLSSQFTSVNLANETYLVSLQGNGSQATINSRFTIYGPEPGQPGATGVRIDNVTLSISYVATSSGWLISNEIWIVTAFFYCPAVSSPSGSTVLTCPSQH